MNCFKKPAQNSIWYMVNNRLAYWHRQKTETQICNRYILASSVFCRRKLFVFRTVKSYFKHSREIDPWQGKRNSKKQPVPGVSWNNLSLLWIMKKTLDTMIAHSYFHDLFAVLTIKSSFPSLGAMETLRTKPSTAMLQNQGMPIKHILDSRGVTEWKTKLNHRDRGRLFSRVISR